MPRPRRGIPIRRARRSRAALISVFQILMQPGVDLLVPVHRVVRLQYPVILVRKVQEPAPNPWQPWNDSAAY